MNMTDDDGTAGFDYNAPEVFERNYALAGFDRRHTFTLAYSCGCRSAARTATRAERARQGLAAERHVRRVSGTPFTVTASNTALDQRGNLQTADLVGDLTRVGIGPDEPYYDPTAFANVTEQRYGNTGRNQFRGPGFSNYNMSLFRTFPLQGRMRLQFRVEGFSVTNKPQWSNPNGSVTSGSFMRINSTRGARQRRRRALRQVRGADRVLTRRDDRAHRSRAASRHSGYLKSKPCSSSRAGTTRRLLRISSVSVRMNKAPSSSIHVVEERPIRAPHARRSSRMNSAFGRGSGAAMFTAPARSSWSISQRTAATKSAS